MAEDVRVLGKYVLKENIGKGAMGSVWLSSHPRLSLPVAIKILDRTLAKESSEYVQRFIEEGRTAAVLNHSNIVRIYDADYDQGYHFLVMEYIDGCNVRELADQKGSSLVAQEVLELAIKMSEALKEAQEAGIVHRDIKPENIMVTSDGKLKLADLGIAKRIHEKDEDEAYAIGTPHYISPEQSLDSRNADYRSDIYSLGATMYHLLTGIVPFDDTCPKAVMMKHVQEPLEHPKNLNAMLPDNICAVVCKMMEKNPLSRYQTYDDLLDDLNKIKHKNADVCDLSASMGFDTLAKKIKKSKPTISETSEGRKDKMQAAKEDKSKPLNKPQRINKNIGLKKKHKAFIISLWLAGPLLAGVLYYFLINTTGKATLMAFLKGEQVKEVQTKPPEQTKKPPIDDKVALSKGKQVKEAQTKPPEQTKKPSIDDKVQLALLEFEQFFRNREKIQKKRIYEEATAKYEKGRPTLTITVTSSVADLQKSTKLEYLEAFYNFWKLRCKDKGLGEKIGYIVNYKNKDIATVKDDEVILNYLEKSSTVIESSNPFILHPRIRLVSYYPITFSNFGNNKNSDKKSWDVYADIITRKGKQSIFKRLNDTIDPIGYQIIDVGVEDKKQYILLKKKNEEPVKIYAGRNRTVKDTFYILINSITQKPFQVMIGKEFEVKGLGGTVKKYSAENFDANSKVLKVRRLEDNALLQVSTKAAKAQTAKPVPDDVVTVKPVFNNTLEAHLSFNGNVDDTVHKHQGKLMYKASLKDNALWLKGGSNTNSAQFLRLANPKGFNLNGSFTWVAKIKTLKPSGGIISRSALNGLWRKGSKALFLRRGRPTIDACGVGFRSTNIIVNDGHWHTIIVTYDAAKAQTNLFVDPAPTATRGQYSGRFKISMHDENKSFEGAIANSDLRIGFTSNSFEAHGFDGLIDEVAIFNKALEGSELQKLITRTMSSVTPKKSTTIKPVKLSDITKTDTEAKPINSGSSPVLLKYQAIYKESVDKFQKTLTERQNANSQAIYRELRQVEQAYKKAGDLDRLVALRNFFKQHTASSLLKLKSSNLPGVKAALVKLAKTNNKSLQQYKLSISQLQESYKVSLQKLVISLTKANKIEDAAIVNAEIENLTFKVPNLIDRPTASQNSAEINKDVSIIKIKLSSVKLTNSLLQKHQKLGEHINFNGKDSGISFELSNGFKRDLRLMLKVEYALDSRARFLNLDINGLNSQKIIFKGLGGLHEWDHVAWQKIPIKLKPGLNKLTFKAPFDGPNIYKIEADVTEK